MQVEVSLLRTNLQSASDEGAEAQYKSLIQAEKALHDDQDLEELREQCIVL